MVQHLLKRDPALLGPNANLPLSWQLQDIGTKRRIPTGYSKLHEHNNSRDIKRLKLQHYVPPNRREGSGDRQDDQQRGGGRVLGQRGRGQRKFQNRRWVNQNR